MITTYGVLELLLVIASKKISLFKIAVGLNQNSRVKLVIGFEFASVITA